MKMAKVSIFYIQYTCTSKETNSMLNKNLRSNQMLLVVIMTTSVSMVLQLLDWSEGFGQCLPDGESYGKIMLYWWFVKKGV